MSERPRILLIKPSSLGDIVHTLPVVDALKRRWPDAHVSWLVKRQWAPLVERVEGVDRIWPVDPTVFGWLSQARALRQCDWDVVMDLQGLFRSAAVGWLVGGPVRIGFANGREGSPLFYTHRVPVSTPEMHAVDRYLLAAAAAGAPAAGRPQFHFAIRQADMEQVRQILAAKNVPMEQPWLALHVSARWKTKRWPLASFAVAAAQLMQEGYGPIVVMGSRDEREEVDALKAITTVPLVDVSGEVPLGCLPAFLSKASAMITNDSGPMHIAAAVGTPVVALFGPTSGGRTGPYGEGHAVLTHDVPCRPCFSRVCRHTEPLACLTHIQPERVVRHIKTLMGARNTAARA